MDTRLRWFGFSGAVLIVALVLFVLVSLHSLPRTTHPSSVTAPIVVTSPEGSVGAPDLTR